MEIIQLAGYTEDEKLQIAKRYLRAAPDRAQRAAKSWIVDRRPRAARDHRRLHARGRRAPARARDRRRSAARSRAQIAEGNGKRDAKKVAVSPDKRVRELLGRPRFHSEAQAAHARCPASRPAWRGRRSAATSCSSRRRAMPGKGKLHADRPARRRDEGVRAGGADVGRAATTPRSRPGLGDGLVRDARHPPARARGRDAEGRPERRASRWRPRSSSLISGARRCATTSR